MKIQCPCGTKYAFDVTPEMVRSPIRFVCQNCGQDHSTVVNQLIRNQYGAEPPAPPTAPAPAPPPTTPSGPRRVTVVSSKNPSTPAPPPPPKPPAAAPAAARLRVGAPSKAAASENVPTSDPPQACLKHAGEITTHQCLVCHKPMCPKCLHVTGYVCSPFCRTKAENQGMRVPVFAGQRDVARSQQWKKVGLITTASLVTLGAIFGVWFWYAWIGSVPGVVASIQLADNTLYGQFQHYAENRIVLLHAGTLARHDTKANKRIWSTPLIDRKRIAEAAAVTFKQMQEDWKREVATGDYESRIIPSVAELTEEMQLMEASAFTLYIHDRDIWVSSPDRLTRFDWSTGKATQAIPLTNGWDRVVQNAGELLIISGHEGGVQQVTQVQLASGESQTKTFGRPAEERLASRTRGRRSTRRRRSRSAPAQRPQATTRTSAPSNNQPLDPAAIAAQAGRLSTSERLTLPATIAIDANQQRLAAELRGNPTTPDARTAASARSRTLLNQPEPDSGRLIHTPSGLVQLSTTLLESKMVERKAMKAPPKKPLLDGNLKASDSLDAASELLNDMQRERGADVVVEDLSRYQVILRRPDNKAIPAWTGEVEGPPDFFPLQTVDVISGSKDLVVIDRSHQKLWSLKLNYNLRRPSNERLGFGRQDQPFGAGPCVERNDTLFIFDAGILTACDRATGNVRWRLPAVGTLGIFFDEEDMIYVNTTTATPESIKYSRQIDIASPVFPLIHKVDPTTGKTLWSSHREGWIAYLSGKFLYTVEADAGQEPPADAIRAVRTGLEIPAHIRIKRLDLGDGQVLWEHYEKQAPLDVHFQENSFQVLFKNELQLLRFFSL